MENLGARRIAELLWAIGWEPHFEARKIPHGDNYTPPRQGDTSSSPTPPSKSGHIQNELDPMTQRLLNDLISKQNPAPAPVG
jgi:hypothetical protein